MLQALSAADHKLLVLITDYDMPGMDCLALLRRCKAMVSGLRTLNISARLPLAIVAEGGAGPDVALPRPFTYPGLPEAVARLIAGGVGRAGRAGPSARGSRDRRPSAVEGRAVSENTCQVGDYGV